MRKQEGKIKSYYTLVTFEKKNFLLTFLIDSFQPVIFHFLVLTSFIKLSLRSLPLEPIFLIKTEMFINDCSTEKKI